MGGCRTVARLLNYDVSPLLLARPHIFFMPRQAYAQRHGNMKIPSDQIPVSKLNPDQPKVPNSHGLAKAEVKLRVLAIDGGGGK